MPSNVLMFEFLAVDHFGPTAEHVSRKLDGIGEKMGVIGKATALALGKVAVGGVAAFGFAMVEGVINATKYQALQLKTAAVIKSTGNAAHISVAGLDEQAHALQEMSGVQEDLVINSENVLATFTNVRNETGKGNDIFNQATGRILDLSVAMGEDLQSATVQVGKALNDPIKGMTALQRVGVTFNATQKEQIKHLVNTGHLMDAQKIILKELGKEFGGAAKAAGSGFGGAMARVKEAIEDTFRDMAIKLLPALTIAANWFADKLPGAIRATGKVLAVLGGWLLNIGKYFVDLGKKYLPPVLVFLKLMGTYFLGIAKTYGPAVIAFFKEIGNRLAKLMQFKVVFYAIAGAISGLLIPVLGVLVGVLASVAVAVWSVISPLLPFLAIGAAIGVVAYLIVQNWSKVAAAFKVLQPIIALVVHYFRDMLFPALQSAASQIFPAIKSAVADIGSAFADHMDVIRTFGQVFMFILKAIGIAIAIEALFFVKVYIPAVTKVLVVVLSIVGPIIRALLAITGMLITVNKAITASSVDIVRTIGNIFGDILGAFSNATKWLYSAGTAIISGLIQGIEAVFPHLLIAAHHTIDYFLGPFKPALNMLYGAGRFLIMGIIHGVEAIWPTLSGAITSIVSHVIGFFAKAGGWLLSAGRNYIVGLWTGIRNQAVGLYTDIAGVIKRVISPFASAGRWLIGFGGDLIHGLWNGISGVMAGIASWINNHIVQPVIRWVKWFFGISSPSRVFSSIGSALISGLIQGIRGMLNSLIGAVRNVVSRLLGIFRGSAKWLWNAGYLVLWGFLQGLKAIWNTVTGWIGGIATWIRNHKGPISLDSRLLIPAGKAIMTGFYNGLKSGAGKAWSFVKSVGGKTKEMLAAGLGWVKGLGWIGFGGNPGSIKGYSAGVSRYAGMVNDVLQMEGLSGSLLGRVLSQMTTESGGNPNAINLWDSNAKAGTPSKGLMQVIDPTFRAFHWPGTSWNIYDPMANIAAALNYARHRYGPGLSALGQGHGYDAGGMATGAGWWHKGPQPERILSPTQTRWFERAMALGTRGGIGARNGGGSVTVILSAPNYLGSRDELYAELNRGARIGRLDTLVRMARGQ